MSDGLIRARRHGIRSADFHELVQNVRPDKILRPFLGADSVSNFGAIVGFQSLQVRSFKDFVAKMHGGPVVVPLKVECARLTIRGLQVTERCLAVS